MEESKKKTCGPLKAKAPRGGNKRKGLCLEDRPLLEANAAGIDIGAREIYVAVPGDRDLEPVRVFSTFTADLKHMAQWLLGCGITTVAMESTGVYWIPVYEIVEAAGITPCLVNARGMKNVPGRRTDWHECQWLQYLHSVGLLRASFRPEPEVVAIRTLLRHRKNLVELSVQHLQHIHKALTQMNLQIHHVISDVAGKTGQAMIGAIVKGERDPAVLAKLRDPNIKASEETLREALTGNWREEHLFTLRQSHELYAAYGEQIEACEREIQKRVQAVEPRVDPEVKPLPPDRKRNRGHQRRKNNRANTFDLRTAAYNVFGVDVTQIPGIETLAIPLFAEVGRDMSKWKTADQFCSWSGLCPDNDITGGKVTWGGLRGTKHRVGEIFRMAAYSLHHSPTPLGDYLRRMKAKLGPPAATVATAHKIAIIFYTMVKRQVEYDESIWAERDALRQQRLERKLKRQAERLGYELVPKSPTRVS